MKTCKAPMQTMRPHWIMLKLKMRFSVLRTVLKFRFSRVRKYFWFRVIVDSWPEILKTDSSRTEVCSGDVPCLEGNLARSSFSTYGTISELALSRDGVSTNRNLEVDKFVGKGTHLIVEAELVVPNLVGSEDEVALPLLFAI
jgi:hypothetical protein